ncbi:hypothetical protein G6F46_004376 [Rhizopus delemar]|uniref:Arrestin C-terminal-like domain-containing protein n=2 Tax=Rhizopus TaxID=4842 RepID=A0A9P6Z2U1_9FUNG|nr:hypothetical protein G6F43_009104 [Rhizopus delemar]KAG1554001.1 hypothetical protein G6F51_000247 [Rhizopus arrhizus]KAG1454397.1 hypothetical protein G6F55_007627 [Rhizopus delemar]KAG1497671.1 hypothetical protein G6F54_005612 [Rhizopus delemar]KAG1514065.1 hypothetical protein G6F53_003957 [Rhizopus delemar]
MVNKPNTKLRIHLENEHLIMYGSSTESSGCVLRGALSLKLKKSTSFKSLNLCFIGKVSVSWNQVGNGCERKFYDTRTVISHTWPFLSSQHKKLHSLSAGIHTFDFELVLPGDLPESTFVDKYYNVEYQLTAMAEKCAFSRNYIARRDVHLSRQRPNMDYFDPITVTNQWQDKLSCQVSLPTKVYTYGDTIPLQITLVPLTTEDIQLRYVSCTFKEYLTCRAVNGWFNGKNKSQGRLVEYTRKDRPDRRQMVINMKVPPSVTDIQCDAHNESVRVRHQLKLILSFEHSPGDVCELTVVLPIVIAITDSMGVLPSYEDVWQTLPYHPFLMLTPSTASIIPPSYHSMVV